MSAAAAAHYSAFSWEICGAFLRAIERARLVINFPYRAVRHAETNRDLPFSLPPSIISCNRGVVFLGGKSGIDQSPPLLLEFKSVR